MKCITCGAKTDGTLVPNEPTCPKCFDKRHGIIATDLDHYGEELYGTKSHDVSFKDITQDIVRGSSGDS